MAWPTYLLSLLAGLVALTGVVRADTPPGGEVKLVLIISRHGIRTPLLDEKQLSAYTAQPWPKWDAPRGYLTDRGRRQMELMGAYYRARYAQEGLLAGQTADDAAAVYLLADSDERTLGSARALGAGLLPGTTPTIHARPQGEPDPLYEPGMLPAYRSDLALATAAVLGRLGGKVAVIPQAYQPAFDALERVLLGPGGGSPSHKVNLVDLPFSLLRGAHGEAVDLEGPLHKGEQLADAILLEYVEGLPLSDVGWGRVDRPTLTQLLQLHEAYFEITQRTFYPAQAQASNLASHILQTMEQSVTGRVQPGAFGSPASRMVVVVGHDTNQDNLGGLLGLNWWLPDTQANPVLPGGALVFELRGTGENRTVRVFYVCQSLEQMRMQQPLTLAQPPEIAPVFVPGCSQAEAGYDVPFAKFELLLRRVIDPRFVDPANL